MNKTLAGHADPKQRHSARFGVVGAQSPNPLPPETLGAEATRYPLSTSEFAALNLVKAQTVRKAFCLTNSYLGVRPRKLANNRLAWPAVQVVA